MKILIVLFVVFTSLPLFSQTKVWEKNTTSAVNYLALSQDGTILATLTKDTLTVWRTDTNVWVRKVAIIPMSNPVISNNNDTVYCLGKINYNNFLYVLPVHGDSVILRPFKELPIKGSFYGVGTFRIIYETFRNLYALKDSSKLLFEYSFTLKFEDPSEYKRGRVGIINLDGQQTSEVISDDIKEFNLNFSSNYLVATGKSHDKTKDMPPRDIPYTYINSLNTGKWALRKYSEYSKIGICRDTNYFVTDEKLYHIPTGDYVNYFNTKEVGTFYSCSSNYDFYIAIKNRTINFVPFISDTAALKIECDAKINVCQLSSNSNRFAIITNDVNITVYDIPPIGIQPTLHADFISDYKKPFVGGLIQFRNNSYLTENKYSVFWEFGDGDTSSVLHPLHAYRQPGVYTVTLTITTESGIKSTMVKTNYIEYKDLEKPLESLWAKRYTNGGVSSLIFISNDSIVAGTTDGSIFSIISGGLLNSYLVKKNLQEYRFIPGSNYPHTEFLSFKAVSYLKKTDELYAIGIPKGISAFAFLVKCSFKNPSNVKLINLHIPSYTWQNLHVDTDFGEKNTDGGYASLDLNSDSTYIHYSNYGSASYYYDTYGPDYYGHYIFDGAAKGNYVGTFAPRIDTFVYDNGMSRLNDNPNTYRNRNPFLLDGAYSMQNKNVYSIRGGLPYNPNSYFVIDSTFIRWIRYKTFDLISSFPTKGTTLRHSPDHYHSFTNDAVWSFADNKKIDSLPLLSAQTFEPFPDGVHLLVRYPNSDTASVFNLQTKSFVHYFKANSTVSSFAISQDGSKVALGDKSGVVTMFDVPPLAVKKILGFEAPSGKKPVATGDTVQFFNTSVPVYTKCRFEWDFGEGFISTEINPGHIYARPGKYTVTLRSICPSESGGDSTSETIVKEKYIEVSGSTDVSDWTICDENPFVRITPNPVIGDGVISIQLPRSEQYSVDIINILGQQVSSFAGQNGMYGKLVLPSLPIGVYFCIVKWGTEQICTQKFIVKE